MTASVLLAVTTFLYANAAIRERNGAFEATLIAGTFAQRWAKVRKALIFKG
jgi:hypothetical protein